MNRLDVRALGWVVTRDALSEIAHVALGGRRRTPLVTLGELGDRWRAVHASLAADQSEPLVAFLVWGFTTSLSKQREKAVVEFVERTASDDVPVEERVAVFDNDGTLWCEKPMPIQADFILRRLYEMAQADPGLRSRQPWKAAYEHDYGWLGTVLAEHYAGNDANVRTLLAGVLAAYEPPSGPGVRVDGRSNDTCTGRSAERI